MEQIKAPFTQAQCDKLNQFQKQKGTHPFTCCSPTEISECKRKGNAKRRMDGEKVPYTDENEGVLIASPEGWICPCGQYRQEWAHSFMAEDNPVQGMNFFTFPNNLKDEDLNLKDTNDE